MTDFTRIQLRRDTAANWTTNNPTLALGEMGIETDTRKFKFGDGSTSWTSLAYASSSSGDIPTKLSELDNDCDFITMDDVKEDLLGINETIISTPVETLDKILTSTQGMQAKKIWVIQDWIEDQTRTDVTPTLTTNSSGACNIDPVEVTPGDVYEYNLNAASVNLIRAIVFTDVNNYVIAASPDPGTTKPVVDRIVVPEGAKYMYVNHRSSSSYPFQYVAKVETSYIQDSSYEIDNKKKLAQFLTDNIWKEIVGAEYSETEEGEEVTYVDLIEDNITAGGYWRITDYISDPTRTDVVPYVDSAAAANKYSTNAIEVEPGDEIQYYFGTSTGSNFRAIVFTNSDNCVIGTSITPTGNESVARTIIAPEEAKYMYVSARTGIGPIEYVRKVVRTPAAKSHYKIIDTKKLLGHIYETFDNFAFINGLKGKRIAVLGDSMSTQKGKNEVEIRIEEEDVGVELSAYLTYYDVEAGLTLGGHTFTSEEIGTEVTFTPVAADVGKVIGLPLNYNTKVERTWWELVADHFECEVTPVCWSGSSICSHEGDTDKLKTSYAWHDAQIRKCGKRIPGTMTRTAPDLIIVYRGGNDMTHAPYAILTDNYFDNYNWEYPSTDVLTINGETKYGFLEGMALTIKKLRETYPDAQIMLVPVHILKRVNYSHFPTNNGINSITQYNKAVRDAAEFFGCQTIDIDKDGITFENCYDYGYITDSATKPVHCSTKGHQRLGDQAIKDITTKLNLIKAGRIGGVGNWE